MPDDCASLAPIVKGTVLISTLDCGGKSLLNFSIKLLYSCRRIFYFESKRCALWPCCGCRFSGCVLFIHSSMPDSMDIEFLPLLFLSSSDISALCSVHYRPLLIFCETSCACVSILSWCARILNSILWENALRLTDSRTWRENSIPELAAFTLHGACLGVLLEYIPFSP